MRYNFAQCTTLMICLATCVAANAGNPKRLTQACPHLAPIDGAPAGASVIDNDMVLQLAEKGRIAAVADSRPTVTDSKSLSPAAEGGIKKRWRAEHRRSVAAIHKLQQQVTKAEGEYQALKSQFFALRKEVQRIRLRPRMETKAHQVKILQKNLQCALDGFSKVVREARLAGAQPGWFRDLPRP